MDFPRVENATWHTECVPLFSLCFNHGCDEMLLGDSVYLHANMGYYLGQWDQINTFSHKQHFYQGILTKLKKWNYDKDSLYFKNAKKCDILRNISDLDVCMFQALGKLHIYNYIYFKTLYIII